MSVTFQKDSASVVLPGPIPGAEVRETKRQVVGRSAGGTLYAYDKGVVAYEVSLAFESLTDDEKDDLVAFFHDEADGVCNTFTYTDSRGTSFTARFLRPDLSIEKVAQDVWDVALVLELNEMAG